MVNNIIQDVSRYQPAIDFPYLKSKGQEHILIKAGSGSLSKDIRFESHYTGAIAAEMIPDPYFWHDPIYDVKAQSNFFISLGTGRKIGFAVIDFEQWWADWTKWQDWNNKKILKSAVPVIPADVLFDKFVNCYNLLHSGFDLEIVTYTADWFLEKYCPQGYEFLKDKWTIWADYSNFSGPKSEQTWEYLNSIAPVGKPIPTLSTSYPLDKVLGRQWTGDRFRAKGVYADDGRTRLSDIDISVWLNVNHSINDISKVDSGGIVVTPIDPIPVKETFAISGRPLQVLNVPYIPQVGENADMYANDCGIASADGLIQAYTDKKPTVDDLYKLTGNTIDKYVSASQIINILSQYSIGSKWMISSMQDLMNNLRSGKPVICLVLYSVLRDAGLTQSQFGMYHFITVVGFDTKFVYVNDPLWNNEGGKALAIPYDIFEKAWKDAGFNPVANPSYGCIIPVNPIGVNQDVSYSTYRITVSSLNVRSTPRSDITTNYIGSVHYPETVKVSEISNGWGKLYDRPGYIFMLYTVKV